LIDDTIIFSGFGTHRTSGDLVKSAIVASLKQCAGSGLWALISLINHSCIANCDHAFIGDMQIVRAREDIEAGCELFISYHDSLPLQSYDESLSGQEVDPSEDHAETQHILPAGHTDDHVW
jgi:SET domain-containing protein